MRAKRDDAASAAINDPRSMNGLLSPSVERACRRVSSPTARPEVIALVQRIFSLSAVRARRVIIFAGVDRESGHSSICLECGEALAALVDASVCVVDANSESPALDRVLQGGGPGLMDALKGASPIREFAMQVDRLDLWLLPLGTSSDGTQGLGTSERLTARIEELRDEFEYVLINASPLHSSADAILLAQGSDGVVLVLEAHSTAKQAALRAKEMLQRANVKVLGAVLNNRK